MKLITLFINIIFLFSEALNAQPFTKVEERFRKRHQIIGMTAEHPFTIFDRHNSKTLDQTVNSIRNRIISEYISGANGKVIKAYISLYKNAIASRPIDNGLTSAGAPSELALWAKNNAFVFLIGLDSNANFIDSLDSTFATRNQFRDRALDGFANLSGMIKAALNYTHLFEGFLAGELLGILTGC